MGSPLIRFKLRSLLIATASVAILITGYKVHRENRLWRNTRFHCQHNAVVTLPSGTTFRTNVWTTTDIDIPTAHVGTGVWQKGRELLYFAQLPESKSVATLTIDGNTERAVIISGYIRHWAAGGTVCEYWVVPESEMPPSDGTRPGG